MENNQCRILYECNMKNMYKCKYRSKDEDSSNSYDCYHREALHCTNVTANFEALKEEIEDYGYQI